MSDPLDSPTAESAAPRGRAAFVALALLIVLGIGGVVIWQLWPRPTLVANIPEPVKPAELVPQVVSLRAEVKLVDVTEAAGIRFRHTNGARGKKLLPETMGGACAFLDFDRDGDQDLLFVNSCPWPGDETSPAPTQALYANDGKGRFSDVTAAMGLALTFYGMGAAIGDYDADGWDDIYFTAVGGDRLFRNAGG